MRHNKLGLLGLSALLMACVGATAFAQDTNAPAPATPGGAPGAPGGRQGRGQGRGQGGGMFGRGQTSLSTLSISTLNYGLNLTSSEKTQIQAIQTKYTTDLKALPMPTPPSPGDPPADPQVMRDAFQKRRDLSTKADTDIQAILTPDQKAKLPDFMKELQSYQQAGIPVAIIGDLKLTADQKTKITTQAQASQTAMQQKRQEAQQSGQRMSREDMQAMMKDNQDKISAILTPTQHAMIDKYLKDHPQPAFGGFGGGGFGGRGARGGGAPGAPGGAPGAPGGN